MKDCHLRHAAWCWAFAIIAAILTNLSAAAQEKLPELAYPVANVKDGRALMVRSVQGIVVDELGAVIPNANIVLRRRNGDQSVAIAQGTTDSVGRFQLEAAKGRHEVVVRKQGFREQVLIVELSKNGGPGFKVVMVVQPMVDYIRTPEPGSQ